MKDLLEKKGLQSILIVSKENAGLLQMMDYPSYKMEDEKVLLSEENPLSVDL